MAGRVELSIVAKNQASAVLKQISGDIVGLGKQSASVSQQLQGMGRAMSMVGAGLTAGVTAPLAGLGLSSINAAADMEQLDIAFTTMLGSASEAKKLMEDLVRFSAQTPFEMPEVVAAGRQLLAFGIEAKDIETTLRQIGDVAAGVGAPIGDLAYLFGTAAASGRLMTIDINQFAMRGIPIIEALGQVMGVAESQVRDMAAEGAITADMMKEAFAVMGSEGGKFAGLMAAQSQSVKGLFSTVKDNVGQTLMVIGQQIIETFDLKRVMSDAIVYLEQARKVITDLAANNPALFKMAIGFGVVAAAIGPVVVGVGMVATAVGAALPVLASMGGVLSGMALPFAAVGAAAAALYYDVGGVRTQIESLAGAVADAMPTIQSMAGDTFAALQWIWEGKAANIDWWGDITNGLVSLGVIGQETGDSLATALFDAGVTIDTIKGKVMDGWMTIKDSITVAVDSFTWSDFIESLTWENIVTTTIDWAAFIAPIAWDGLLTTLDWATYIGQLTWDNAIVPALDWAAYVAPLAWGAVVATLGDWGNYIAALDWSGYIGAVLNWGAYVTPLAWNSIVTALADWGAYIQPLAWAGIVAALDWAAYVAPLAWEALVSTLGDWGAYITTLDWTTIITTAIDWATWIPALSWAGFITALEWSAYLAVFAWEAFVTVLDWATVAGSGIDWTAFVNVLTWENLVTALDWVAFIGAFTWDSFITKLEWTGTIAKLENWGTFVSDLAWSTYVAAIDWATVAPVLAWEAFIAPLGAWTNFIAQLPWSTFINALGDWSQFVATVNWDAFITGLSWAAFVTALSWSSFIPGFSWAAFVPRLQWPSIPSFPGWGALAQSLFGGGGASAPAGATGAAPAEQSSGGGVIDDILNRVGLATGARNYPGGWTWVGEQGRELMYVPPGADVYSKRDSMGVLAQAGRYASEYNMAPEPVMVTQNITFHVNNEIDLNAAAYKLADIMRRRR